MKRPRSLYSEYLLTWDLEILRPITSALFPTKLITRSPELCPVKSADVGVYELFFAGFRRRLAPSMRGCSPCGFDVSLALPP